ncbi:RipA family octameric membrane protein [Streptomyces tibetensis]|uniref:RipA family octameric membrane protein n=1 Tax=Streptomyces tibetensis TaxID=2382123 RepID=UPI0033C3453C
MAEIGDSLWNDDIGASDYRDSTASYHAAVFEQYKLCVEMADRVSARRNLANTFFLTLHSSLLVFLGAWLSHEDHRTAPVVVVLVALLVLLGMCATWWFTVRSYQQLNRGKFEVIGALEERLPARTFVVAEWRALGEGKDWRVYLPLNRVERWIPLLFAVAYILGSVAIAF